MDKTILISLIVAIITSITTTFFHWFLWKIKFEHQEKLEYRSIFINKRVCAYEEISQLVSHEGLEILECITPFHSFDSNRQQVAINKLESFYKNLTKLVYKYHLFVSEGIRSKTTDYVDTHGQARGTRLFKKYELRSP